MLAVGEEELVCDLAETYQIYDYRQLPPNTVAVFAIGLRDDSRTKMKLCSMKVPASTLLLAQIADAINTLVWMNSKDCRNASKRPKSLVEALAGTDKAKEKPISFKTGTEFEAYRQALIRKGGYAT